MTVSSICLKRRLKTAAWKNPMRLIRSLEKSISSRENFADSLRRAMSSVGHSLSLAGRSAPKVFSEIGKKSRAAHRLFWDYLTLSPEARAYWKYVRDTSGVRQLDEEGLNKLFELTAKSKSWRGLPRMLQRFLDFGWAQRFDDDLVLKELGKKSFENQLGPVFGFLADLIVRDWLNFLPNYKQVSAYGPAVFKDRSYSTAVANALWNFVYRSPYTVLTSALASNPHLPRKARNVFRFLNRSVFGGPLYYGTNLGLLGLSLWLLGVGAYNLPRTVAENIADAVQVGYNPDSPEEGRRIKEEFLNRLSLSGIVWELVKNELRRPWMPTDPIADLHTEYLKQIAVRKLATSLYSPYHHFPDKSLAVHWLWPTTWNIGLSKLRSAYGKEYIDDEYSTDELRRLLHKYFSDPSHRSDGRPLVSSYHIAKSPVLNRYLEALGPEGLDAVLAGFAHRNKQLFEKALSHAERIENDLMRRGLIVDKSGKLVSLPRGELTDIEKAVILMIQSIRRNSPHIISPYQPAVPVIKNDMSKFMFWKDLVKALDYYSPKYTSDSEQARKEWRRGAVLSLLAQSFLDRPYLNPEMRRAMIDYAIPKIYPLRISPYVRGSKVNFYESSYFIPPDDFFNKGFMFMHESPYSPGAGPSYLAEENIRKYEAELRFLDGLSKALQDHRFSKAIHEELSRGIINRMHE